MTIKYTQRISPKIRVYVYKGTGIKRFSRVEYDGYTLIRVKRDYFIIYGTPITI